MTVIEEHYLDLEEATAADTGVYICRVSYQNHLVLTLKPLRNRVHLLVPHPNPSEIEEI